MALLVRIIHLVPALAGLGATLALIPLSTLVGRAMAAVRKELVAYTDARVKLCTEVITGEPPATDRTLASRHRPAAQTPGSQLARVRGRQRAC